MAASPAINCEEPVIKFVTAELTTADPSYTFEIDAPLKLGVVITNGLTIDVPTTTRFWKLLPVLLQPVAAATLY